MMRLALRLARRGYGCTSPNPMVGAVLVRRGQIIGQGWHRRAGQPHAEIEALQDAARRGLSVRQACLYVTLEPCSTHGRTPPCTEAIIHAGIRKVVAATVDPNPAHSARGFAILRRAGLEVKSSVLEAESKRLNEAFDHWIVHQVPFVTVKAAMSLDGKIATKMGDARWITGEKARAWGMRLRQGADAVLVGINTILADNPSLAFRGRPAKRLRRIVLDSCARTPLQAKVVADAEAASTTIVITSRAPARRRAALARRVRVLTAPARAGRVDVRWLLDRLGDEQVTSLLVEGGGEVNASFLLEGLAQRVVFFYAPKIVGGATAPKAVAGPGIADLARSPLLEQVEWKRLGPDLLMTALVKSQADLATDEPGASRADIPVCRLGRLSSRPKERPTGKSGGPAGRKACPTTLRSIAPEQVPEEQAASRG